MDSLLLQIGVGGIFSILVLREVFSYLTKRNGSVDAGRLKHIDDVISARDQQNERLIYREPGIRAVLEKLTETIEKTGREQTDAITGQTRWLQRVDDRLDSIESRLK